MPWFAAAGNLFHFSSCFDTLLHTLCQKSQYHDFAVVGNPFHTIQPTNKQSTLNTSLPSPCFINTFTSSFISSCISTFLRQPITLRRFSTFNSPYNQLQPSYCICSGSSVSCNNTGSSTNSGGTISCKCSQSGAS